jgi:hypothetical protein
MARLPAVLGTDDLPLPELCAARLDGELFAIGTGWSPIDEPDLPSFRAAAVAPPDRDAYILERRSAAWVHGAVHVPPAVPQYCVPYLERSTVRPRPTCTVRQVVIDEADVTIIGGIRATTRLRTALDLLRDGSLSDDEAVGIVAALIGDDPLLGVRVRERITSAHRLPHKGRALARLARTGAQPSLTR